MSGRAATVIGAIGAIMLLQTPIRAQSDEAHVPGSLARIRAALSAPPGGLSIPAAAPLDDLPLFRTEVEDRLTIKPPDEEPPFDPTWGLPTAGELVMDGIGRIKSAVVNYRRGRAERRAKKEVEDALAAFCAQRGCPVSTIAK